MFKGKAESDTIELLQDGNSEFPMESHPLMEIEQQYILFLEVPLHNNLIMVGGPTSKYELDHKTGTYFNTIGDEIDNKARSANK